MKTIRILHIQTYSLYTKYIQTRNVVTQLSTYMQFGRENYSVMGDLVYRPMHTAYMATVSTHIHTHTGVISVDQSRSAHMIITSMHASDRLRPTRYVC